MAKVIAFANQKGGVAKTTSAFNFAAGLGRMGYKVLGIDLDPQANMTSYYGTDGYDCPTIYDVLKKKEKPEDAIQVIQFFDIIPSNILLAGAEQEIVQAGKEFRLKETMESVVDKYDYIVLDCPPSLGVLTSNAFTFADEVIIPTTAGFFAASGIGQLNNLIKTIKKYCNPNLKIRGILITKHNPRSVISQDMTEFINKIAEALDAPVFETHIRQSVTIEESQADMVDIFVHAPKSKPALDYKAFINEYLEGEE